ncbi:MAG: phosphate ABC transporter substrate-binding protein, partial [Enterococcus sp.]
VQTLNIDNVEPTDENVTTNRWKIWAYEHMYTKGKPTELVADFLDYMLSDEVQGKVVSQLGYIPISEMKVERDWQGNEIK